MENFTALEEQVHQLEYANANKRADLAKLHHENEEIGILSMKKKAEIEKLESLRTTFKNTLNQMELLDKEKKQTVIESYRSKIATLYKTKCF